VIHPRSLFSRNIEISHNDDDDDACDRDYTVIAIAMLKTRRYRAFGV